MQERTLVVNNLTHTEYEDLFVSSICVFSKEILLQLLRCRLFLFVIKRFMSKHLFRIKTRELRVKSPLSELRCLSH